jgi:hypothetical protein
MIDSDIVTSLVLQTHGVEHVMYAEVESRYSVAAGTLLEKNNGMICVIGRESKKTMPVSLATKARRFSGRKDGESVYFEELDKDILDVLSVYLCTGVVFVERRRNEEFLRWAEIWEIPGFVS